MFFRVRCLALLLLSTVAAAGTPSAVIEGTIANQWVQGGLQVTDRSLDLAIQGNGFFMIGNEAGICSFTRSGRFELLPDGYLRHMELDGDLVTIIDKQRLERLRLRNIARWRDGFLKGLRIDLDGTIKGFYTNGYARKLGRIALALFQNQRRLQRIDNSHGLNFTNESGGPFISYAQEDARGSIYSHTLESLDDQIYNMALDSGE